MVHPTQARLAFGAHVQTARFATITGDSPLTLDYGDGGSEVWVPARPERLGAILTRADLTQRDGWPVAITSAQFGLIGVAVGPATMPGRLRVLYGVFSLADESLPAPADDQPAWLLLDARPEET